jgi:hypothetical protein
VSVLGVLVAYVLVITTLFAPAATYEACVTRQQREIATHWQRAMRNNAARFDAARAALN